MLEKAIGYIKNILAAEQINMLRIKGPSWKKFLRYAK